MKYMIIHWLNRAFLPHMRCDTICIDRPDSGTINPQSEMVAANNRLIHVTEVRKSLLAVIPSNAIGTTFWHKKTILCYICYHVINPMTNRSLYSWCHMWINIIYQIGKMIIILWTSISVIPMMRMISYCVIKYKSICLSSLSHHDESGGHFETKEVVMSVISSGFHISLTAWRSVSKDPWKGFCVLSHTYEANTLMKQLLLSQFSQEMPQSVPYDREDNLSVLCSCPWVCTLLDWLRMLLNMTVLYWLVGHGRGPQILGTHRYLPPYYV